MTFEWSDDMPRLRAARLTLRPLIPADVPALFEVFGDSEVMRYWSRPPLASLADADALLHEIHEGFRTRSFLQWGIEIDDQDGIAGTCTLFRIERAHRRAEIGFALGRRHWGRGFASEAAARAVGFAFESLGLHRIEADADPRNARSLRLLEGLGFVREGILRERYHVNGEIQDAVILGLLRAVWIRRRG
ncbi:MAG: GNAT family N-acetyltransferase [Acidobacteria bacterium]|nr:GNAT family N-acetyltransferase [Acidobacteriota bacterium]